jgi:hypothetical protein
MSTHRIYNEDERLLMEQGFVIEEPEVISLSDEHFNYGDWEEYLMNPVVMVKPVLPVYPKLVIRLLKKPIRINFHQPDVRILIRNRTATMAPGPSPPCFV